jgi:hypothetical protein
MNHEALLLSYIQSQWRITQLVQLERGIWVALHEEISEEAQADFSPSTPVVRSWFVTDRAIEECPLVSYNLFTENRYRYPLHVGHSSIAPYPQAGSYYMDFDFGALAGGGMRVSIDRWGEVISKVRLWSA